MRISEFPLIRTFLKKLRKKRVSKDTLRLRRYQRWHIQAKAVHHRLVRANGVERIHLEQEVGICRTAAIVFEDRTFLIEEIDERHQTILAQDG